MFGQILLNLFIALLWMSLHNSWHLSTLIVGYLVGLLLIFALRRFNHQQFYFRRVLAIVRLLLLFFKELVLSSFFVLKEILRPTARIKPGIIAVPTHLRSDWELTVFSMLITLTPGTLTLEISEKRDILFIHTMDIADTELVVKQIKNTFESAIMEVTR